MSLREEMEALLSETLEDPELFGWPITVTDPGGESAQMYGQSTDISLLIDPSTKEAVSGRTASVVLRMSSLVAAGFTSLPKGISDMTLKPWRMDFQDILLNDHTFKVKESNPDRTLGILVCIVEVYRP